MRANTTHDHTLTVSGITATDAGESLRMLLIASSKAGTEVVNLSSDETLTFGRSEAASVRMHDPSLSRLHARFRRSGDTVIVTDLDSRNGTFSSGQRISETELRVGQSVVLGNVTVELRAAPVRDAAMLGIADFDAISSKLADELARARSFRRPMSVVLLRPRARVPVSTYAAECWSALRAVDRVGLYDRHSLLVILPESSLEHARRIATELTVRAGPSLELRAGVAAYPEFGSTVDQLLAAAVAGTRGQPSLPETGASGRKETLSPASAAMQDVQRLVERVAASRISVLIAGETGVGKEVVARRIHESSPRAAAPLIAVNCGAIPEHLVESTLFGHVRGAFTGADRTAEGLFEQAAGGTLFLDEVGELPKAAQAALLRALDSGRVRPVGGSREIPVDVRFIAASHRDLLTMTKAGTFRADLYHRLNGVTVSVPPLRERREEIMPLALHFVASVDKPWGGAAWEITDEARALLEGYEWPGNVRELRNVIERAIALAEESRITPAELPPHLGRAIAGSALSSRTAAELPQGGLDLRLELERHEQSLIQRALELAGGRQRKAAELLKLPLRTLERKLSKLGRADAERDTLPPAADDSESKPRR